MEDLPVKEDYWGYEDISDGDKEIVRKGFYRVKKEIDSRLWQDIDYWEDDLAREYFVGEVERACLRQLLSKYQSLVDAPYKPTPKELAKHLIGEGVVCNKERTSLFGSPWYTVKFSGRIYNITKIRGEDTCCIETGPNFLYTIRDLRIYLKPQTFYALMNHLTRRIVPLIGPEIEAYIWEVKKKILVSEIYKAARRGRK